MTAPETGRDIPADPKDIAARLRALFIMDEVGSYNPLGQDAARMIEDQAARIASLEAERARTVEWRPIKTAPKDGTRIDLWIDGARHTDCHWGFPEHSCGEYGQYCDSDWHRLKAGWVDGTFNEALDADDITHWMPMPADPALASEKGGQADG